MLWRTSEFQNSSYLPSTSLQVISETTRHIFFGIFLAICVTSTIGNFCVISTISKRKYRYVQKTCIISLAMSDLLSTAVICLNNLETFSHPLINWTLGEFLCSFIPMCQMVAITASSVALVIIAMDRYRNVVHAFSKRWNPKLIYCITSTMILWIFITALSFPMYTFFQHEPIRIIYLTSDPVFTENTYICASFMKDKLTTYYISMTVIIFMPLLLVFLWFYYNIAVLIWKHRKPLTLNKGMKSSEMDSTSNTKTTEISVKTSSEQHLKSIMSKNNNIRVERKIRTFKIIVVIMVVFIFCRLPYYAFYIVKLKHNPGGEGMWILNYSFIALNVFNCVLNPLLYTFLKQTLNVCIKIHKTINDFTCKVCCCCFSNAEFEDYERDNPFMVQNFEPRKSLRNMVENHQSSIGDSRVKFEDSNQTESYKQIRKY